MPQWKLLDDLLLDSQAIQELTSIIMLQEQWLKHRASSMYIDPLLVQLKIKLLSREQLADALAKSWHPSVFIDQVSPRGLERAFTYWRDLIPWSERFKDEFGSYGTKPGGVDFDDLIDLGFMSKQQFQVLLKSLQDELLAASKAEDWLSYRKFVAGNTVDESFRRAFLAAFLISEGKASLRIDPLTEEISIISLREIAKGEPRSVAIPQWEE